MNKNFIFSLALLAFIFGGVHGMQQMKKGKYVPVPSNKKPKKKWLEQFNNDQQGAAAANQFANTTVGSYVIINGYVPSSSLNRVLSNNEKTSVLK